MKAMHILHQYRYFSVDQRPKFFFLLLALCDFSLIQFTYEFQSKNFTYSLIQEVLTCFFISGLLTTRGNTNIFEHWQTTESLHELALSSTLSFFLHFNHSCLIAPNSNMYIISSLQWLQHICIGRMFICTTSSTKYSVFPYLFLIDVPPCSHHCITSSC